MAAAPSHRLLLALASAVAFAGVPILFVIAERPGLGLGHFFYLPIALFALATNRWLGALGGVVATALYAISVILNPHFPSSSLIEASTAIRALTYVSSGVLIGWFASSNRALVDRLRSLAERDYLTGLLNVRSFEEELHRRCVEHRRFAVVLGDLDGLKDVNDRDGHAEGNLLLRRVSVALQELLPPDTHVARIGGDEFGMITTLDNAEHAAALCRELEREFEHRRIDISFGWALHPTDGGLPVGLFRRADERLYASKDARRSRRSVVALLGGLRDSA